MIFWALALGLSPTPPAEVARLNRWFEQAAAIVEAQAAPAAAHPARAAVLADLRLYVAGGLFPANPEPGWAPVFVDAEGTRCAVAHLLEISGEEALMHRLAATHNRSEVLDFADDPAMLAWLDEQGLTPAEAAAIQPSYEGPPQPTCLCDYWGDGDRQEDAQVVLVEATEGGVRVLRSLGGLELFEAGEVITRDLPRLHGAGPWLLLLTRWSIQPLPMTDPCPALVPYPGVPPPPLTPEQIAEAVLAGSQCSEVLANIDSRWNYEGSCSGCESSQGPISIGILGLFGLLTARRRGPGTPR
jgi:hypothetical protein